MHLEVLYTGQRARARLALGLMRMISGLEPDEVVRTSLYRPGFFGRPFLRLVRAVMRGPSDWSPGEREMLAASVSNLNRCSYCAQIHGNLTRLRLDGALDEARVRNWRALQLAPRLVAGLELVEAFTVSAERLSAAHVRRAREAGLSDAMIADALHVAFVFNVINRIANAFGFDWHGAANAARGAAILNRVDYKVPGVLLS